MGLENIINNSFAISINGNKNKKVFEVMNRDIPLFKINEKNEMEIYEENYQYFPYALKKNNISFIDYYKWAPNRVLLLDRSNAKKLLNICNIPQDDRYEIARACRLISLDDCFWIRENEDEKWFDYDLHHNSLNKAVTQIALNGEYITITGEVTTAEFTNAGSYAKGWERREDGIYLLKKSDNDFASEKEVLVSDILDLLNVEHIQYKMHSEGICECKCMTNDELSRLNYGEFAKYHISKGMNPISQFIKLYQRQFAIMNVIDYIVANTDRHGGNWGLYIDNETNRILRPHPLYDHNCSFDCTMNDEYKSVVLPGITMKELAEESQKIVKLDLDVIESIDKARFEAVGAYKEDVLTRVLQTDDRNHIVMRTMVPENKDGQIQSQYGQIPNEKDLVEIDYLAETKANKKDDNVQDDERNDAVEEQVVEEIKDIDEPTPGEE